jgi:hypothetical protein
VVALTLNGAPWRALGATLLVAAVLGLTGCAQGQGYDASLPTASTARSAVAVATAQGGAAADDTKAAILAGYRAYWDAMIAAGETADANSPLLAEHATSLALGQARLHFSAIKRVGQVDRGTVTLHPKVVSVKGAAATVRDCPDISHWHRIDPKTGAVHDPPDAGRRASLAVLYLVQGTWKVAVITRKELCEG